MQQISIFCRSLRSIIMNHIKSIAASLLAVSFFISCKHNNTSQQEENKPQQSITNVNVPDFNADSAYDFTARQVSFGPRIPGTPAQNKCAAWLEAKLRSYTPNVYVQNTKLEIYNHSQVP